MKGNQFGHQLIALIILLVEVILEVQALMVIMENGYKLILGKK